MPLQDMLADYGAVISRHVLSIPIVFAAALTGCDIYSGPDITPLVTTDIESTWAPAAIGTAAGTAIPTQGTPEAPTLILSST